VTERHWAIEVERRAERDLERLDPPVRGRVLDAIARLAIDPANAQIRKLQGRPESRLRIGDWRVIFDLDAERQSISIKRVLPRGRAYRK